MSKVIINILYPQAQTRLKELKESTGPAQLQQRMVEKK